MKSLNLDEAFDKVQALAFDFKANKNHYLSPDYQEAEVRKDFIDKFFIALGWDVNHETQKNPYEQEVKVERTDGSARRADYAFRVAPNYRDVLFYVEAKKPFGDIATADNYFQTIRYGWNSQTPVAVLTDFEQFQIIDCRYKPDIASALHHCVKKYHYGEYADREKFAEIYYLFSREAAAGNALEKFAETLPKRRGKAIQRGLFPGGYQSIDESFLNELNAYRATLAQMFKKCNPSLDGDALTELTQRTLDRLVFIRFLEDKLIEPNHLVGNFGEKGTVWEDFIASSHRLDGIYNGIVFKKHVLLDAPTFKVKDEQFGDICEQLSHKNSPYLFNVIPIHILGDIYEQFLGKVIVTTSTEARIQEKPEVRKAGGVYYTPEYIVSYIVQNTVGKLIEHKTPGQIADMRFADIACGSGSFLLGVYDLLLRYHTKYYNDHPEKAKKGDCNQKDGSLHLSLRKKREILLRNIYGVDIDAQAVEVAQLSLYLKMLEEETTASAHEHQLEFHETLLPTLSKNIICGNSLIGTDILASELFVDERERKLNPMDFDDRFSEIFKRGGFDVIVGNPPYLYSAGQENEKYFKSHFHLSQYQTDFYVYFIEQAILKLRDKGYLGMIVSDSWLKGKYFANLREYVLEQTKLHHVTVFDYPPFKGATIENSILVLQKDKPPSNFLVRKFANPLELTELNKLKPEKCLQNGFVDIHYSEANSRILAHLESNTAPLITFCRLNRGVHAYRTDGYGKSKYSQGHQTARDKEEQSYHSVKKLNSTYLPEIKGKHLNRYQHTWDGTYISYGDWLAEARSPEFFMNPKLAIRKIIGPRLVCTFIAEPTVLDQSVYVAIRESSKPPALLLLLGILSSSIGGWYIQKKHGIYDTLYPWFTKEHLANFPIPNLDYSDKNNVERHSTMVQLVKQMLDSKGKLQAAKSDKDKAYYEGKCSSLDRQIDRFVYELYSLGEDDIRLIEGELSRDKSVPSSSDLGTADS